MAEYTFEELWEMSGVDDPSAKGEPVGWDRGDDGHGDGWGFYDETWSYFHRAWPSGNPPFLNRKAAEKGLKKYCKDMGL